MKFQCTFLLIFLTGLLSAQETYTGLVLDSLTHAPMRYANFSWNNGQGAISNEEGGYELSFNPEDSPLITVTYIGYRDLELNSKALKDTLYLSPEAYKLDEVVLIDTDDLKNKILSNFKNNYDTDAACAEFFYKQFLKENDQYVNYLEAIGEVKNALNAEDQVIYIQGVRKTDNLITSYINFNFQSLSRLFKRVSKNMLNDAEILDYKWISPSVIEATIKDYSTKKRYVLTINTSDYSIQKVVKNDLTDQLDENIFSKTMYIDRRKKEVAGFLQGEFFEYEFKKVGDTYHLSRMYHKGKGVVLSKDQSMEHQFVSEQLYVATNTLGSCSTKEGHLRLKKGKALRKVHAKYKDWSKVNGILPLKEQQQILNTLGELK